MSNLFKFAENILNNLDQSTQSSIQSALNKNSNDNKSSKVLKSRSKNLDQSQRPSGDKSATTTNLMSSHSSASLKANMMAAGSAAFQQNTGFKSFSSNNSSSNLAAASKSINSSRDKDEELIDFLNSSEFSQVFSEPALNFTSKASLEINTSNMIDSSPPPSSSSQQAAQLSIENSPSSQQQQRDDSLVQFSIGSSRTVSGGNDSKSNGEDETVSINESIGDDAEKTMLKAEIKSLNHEVQSLVKRIKAVEEDYQRVKRKSDQYQSQVAESDKIIRELRAREDDLNEALRSKDSQIAVLRVRFDELDADLKRRDTDLAAARADAERVLRDHSNSSDLHAQLVDTLKSKCDELEASLAREKEAYTNIQRESMNVQTRLESEKQTFIESLNSLEKRFNEEKNKNNELNSLIKNSKTTYNFLKQEFEEYKTKASKTLAAKDRLIATLKENASSLTPNENNEEQNEGGSLSSGGISLKSIEIDELKMERDALKEELNSKNVSLEMLRAEIMELESQSSVEIELLKDQLRGLQDSLDESKQSKEYMEQDLKSLRQQLEYAQDELYKQKTAVNQKVQEKEVEIEKLRSQLTTKNLGTTSEKELENRLHLLTENLIQKQTLIEALQSEKHSIFLQLERTEKRLQDYETILASKKTTTSIRMHDDDENSNRVSAYFRESPYDHGVTRKVKQAVSEIDKFSIRLGVFLKKYPIARIFVIVYMFLLHLWVVVVLFTYKPEVHHISFDQPPGVKAP